MHQVIGREIPPRNPIGSQHPHGMQTARCLDSLLHIGRVVSLAQGTCPRAVPGRIIHVEQVPALRIQQMRHLTHRHQSLPIRRWVAPIHRLGVIELRIADGNKVTVPISDVAVGIRKDRVVGGVRPQLHGLAVFGIVPRLSPQVTLLQSGHGSIHQLDGDPTVPILPDHRPVQGVHRL